MKGLGSLIRMQKWKVDEQRRRIGELEATRGGFLRQIGRLEQELKHERSLLGRSEMTVFFGHYEQAVTRKRETLERSVAELDKVLEESRRVLAGLFSELKRYEIVAERRAEAEAKAAERVEQAELDEIGGLIHIRKQRAGAR